MLARLLLVAVPFLAAYLYNKIRFKRFKQYAHLPQLEPSLLLGHLKAMDDYMKRSNKADCHSGAVPTY